MTVEGLKQFIAAQVSEGSSFHVSRNVPFVSTISVVLSLPSLIFLMRGQNGF